MNFGSKEVNSRSCDDNFSIHQLAIEGRVLSLFVGGGDDSVTLLFEPLPETQFVLSGTQKTRLLLGMDATLVGTLATR